MNNLTRLSTGRNVTKFTRSLPQIIGHCGRKFIMTKRFNSTHDAETLWDKISVNKYIDKDTSTFKEMDDKTIGKIRSTLNKLRLELQQNGINGVNEILSSDVTNKGNNEENLRIDLAKEIEKLNNPVWKPTKEQVDEYNKLKERPIPVRFDPIVQHVINMLMRDGKKQKAERTLNKALHLVYCQTRLDPVKLLKDSLVKLAPLMITKTFRTGIAKASMIPVPLNQRQRNRMAWGWIIESANKRNSSDLSVRLAEELLAIHRGDSSCFDKKFQIQKTAISNRAYIKVR